VVTRWYGVRGWLVTLGLVVLTAFSSRAMAQDTKGTPRLRVANKTIDLGVLKDGVVATLSFVLENHGSADLVIRGVRADCGCTVIKLSDEDRIIPPSGRFELMAKFDTRGRSRPGVQTNSIKVTTNDPVEPEVHLQFTALVVSLFRRLPTGNLLLQKARRGTAASKTLDLMAGSVGLDVEVVGIEFNPPVPMKASVGPFSERGRSGQRVKFLVDDNAPLGTLLSTVTVKIKVGDEVTEEEIPVRLEVVGDLSFRPTVVDTTRRKSLRGQWLIPVTVESTSKMPFKILKVEAGALLDVSVKPGRRKDGSAYYVQPQIKGDAPVGPFGAMLSVYTDSLDQPLLRIPVYGEVSPAVMAEPPLVMLHSDGTGIGEHRSVKLRATGAEQVLEVLAVESSHPFVAARVDVDRLTRYSHTKYLTVALKGDVPAGRHEVRLTVSTTIPGAEKLEIPVTVLGPQAEDDH